MKKTNASMSRGKRTKPNPDDLFALAEKVIGQHRKRDSLYNRLETDLYFNEGPGSDDPAVQTVRLPLGTNVVNLIVDMMGSQNIIIDRPALSKSDKDRTAADQLEVFLLAWWDQNNAEQSRNLVRDMAFYAVMRDMVALRVLCTYEGPDDPDEKWEADPDELPIVVQVRDPQFVYPVTRNGKITAVFECYPRLAADIREQYEDALPDMKKYPDDEEVAWLEYWDDTYCVYWAGSEVVKSVREHGYGTQPYTITYARSTPLEAPERKVRPMLAPVAGMIDNMNVLMSAYQTAVLNYVNTSWVFKSPRNGGQNPEENVEIGLKPGQINYLLDTEEFIAIQRAPIPPDLMTAFGQFHTNFQEATVPGILFGELGQRLAGYAVNLLMGAGRRVLKPIQEAIEAGITRSNRKMLQISDQYLAPAMDEPISIYQTATEKGKGGKAFTIRKTLQLDVDALGGYYEAKGMITDPMPQDEAADLHMAIEATNPQNPLLSKETALKKFLHVEDITEEQARVMLEKLMANPAIEAPYLVRLLRDAGLPIPPELLAQAMGQPPQPQMPQQNGNGNGPPQGQPQLPPGIAIPHAPLPAVGPASPQEQSGGMQQPPHQFAGMMPAGPGGGGMMR